MSKFYLTTPLYYPNARPHVGSAYTTIVCDTIARFKRQCGHDVAFLTGTDEHGEKLARAAAAAGISPREFVAEKRKLFVDLWKLLNISTTHFVYTDQVDHVQSVQRLLRRARERDKDCIYKRRYEGRYCVHCERYVSDNTEPINCDTCGRPAEPVSEENYFFRLSAFQDRLLRHYADHPEFVRPDFRLNEVTSFVKSGLRDISISRKRIKWGIPWPDDPEQVFYVWYDALIGYMTGIGYAQGENGNADFQKFWPADVHMIGKDILRFHAVYWPAFLMAADLPLPKTVFAHGWIYYEQDKMSKSKGNVVYPEPIVDALDSFGSPGNDALRYYLLREATFGQDMSFSYDGLIQRYNSDLANDLGNLANRTIAMVHQYFGGEVPEPPKQIDSDQPSGMRADVDGGFDLPVGNEAGNTINQFQRCFEDYDFSRGIEKAWEFVAKLNRYLVLTQPWVLAGEPSKREQLGDVLYKAAESLRIVAVLVHPILPLATEKLWRQLGQPSKLEEQRLHRLAWGVPGDPTSLKAGTRLGKPEPIFPRLDKEKTLAKLHEFAEADYERDKPKEALKSVETKSAKAPEPRSSTGFQPVKEDTARMAVPRTPSPQPPAPSTSQITIEDFAKVDMRVGEVLSAEPVPGTQKLLKLTVDIGNEVRQVVAGIAGYYQPEQLVGMKVVLVVNLEPRKLRGVESNGMIVAATVGEEGKPVLVTFKEDVPNGARLK